MNRFAAILEDARADWSRLQAHWELTQQHWRDELAAEFERGRWRAWDETVPAYLRALEELNEVAKQVSRETGDSRG
jgi:hypothetical protein